MGTHVKIIWKKKTQQQNKNAIKNFNPPVYTLPILSPKARITDITDFR